MKQARYWLRYLPRSMWAEAFWTGAASITHTLYMACKANAVLAERLRRHRS